MIAHPDQQVTRGEAGTGWLVVLAANCFHQEVISLDGEEKIPGENPGKPCEQMSQKMSRDTMVL